MSERTTIEGRPTQVLTDGEGPIPAFGPVPQDEHGRIVLSEADWRDRAEAALRVLRLLPTLPDEDPPGVEVEMMRGIDATRPHRKLFEGMY